MLSLILDKDLLPGLVVFDVLKTLLFYVVLEVFDQLVGILKLLFQRQLKVILV
jgi:hypothetical protein